MRIPRIFAVVEIIQPNIFDFTPLGRELPFIDLQASEVFIDLEYIVVLRETAEHKRVFDTGGGKLRFFVINTGGGKLRLFFFVKLRFVLVVDVGIRRGNGEGVLKLNLDSAMSIKTTFFERLWRDRKLGFVI
jgi:hypothetical protein